MDPSPPPSLIAIVDDDQGLVRLVEKSLRREGHDVVGFNSGRAALDWLKDHQVDLWLIDLKLPDMQGDQLIRKVAHPPVSQPFLVITGQGDEKVAVQMMKQGAMDYLVKDVRFQEFVPTVVGRALQQIERDRKLASAEAALRQEHQFTSAILNTCSAPIIVLDSAGQVVRFNRACETITGYAAREMLGQTIWEKLIPAEERSSVQAHFARLTSGDFPNSHQNYWITRRGEPRLITWSNTALTDAEGRVEYIVGTGVDITERKQLERKILQISENEQRRIGQDLHDGLCQQLAGIEFMSQALAQKLSAESITEEATANHITQLIRDTIAQTRDLAKGLSPVILDSEGLMTSLKLLTTNIGVLFQVKCLWECPLPVHVHDNAVATHLFRIAQEAVNNALRHGRADRIQLSLLKEDSRIKLAIRDNGRGLRAGTRHGKGMGLQIMRYRADMIGGTLTVQRAESGGTSVVCSLLSKPSPSSNNRRHETSPKKTKRKG